MEGNFWGRYLDDEPTTHFDPLQSFWDQGKRIGFRVNFMPGRSKRPREQHTGMTKTNTSDPISDDEIKNSPLYRVYRGFEAGVPIAGDNNIIGRPDGKEITREYTEFSGITIMNKFAPLGLNSKQANGVAMVSFPSEYTRTLDNPKLIFDLMKPMKTSLKFLLEDKGFKENLKTPLTFFNVGPSSGASIRYLHGQSYAIPFAQGLLSYAFTRAFKSSKDCLACKIGSSNIVVDHLDQKINYEELTIWEDSNVRVVYPFAPMRTMQTRIIPKFHVSYLGEVSLEQLKSIAKAISIADYLMNPPGQKERSPRLDRTISFRQTSSIGEDFHMCIDLLPPFPLVASETVDFLGLSPFKPEIMAYKMKNIDVDHLEDVNF